MDLNALEQHIMLAILRCGDSAYGVAIQDELEERTGKRPSTGSVYAALDRLETKGFVRSRQGEATPQRGGKAKVYFRVTAPGQAALSASLRKLERLRQGTALAGGLA